MEKKSNIMKKSILPDIQSPAAASSLQHVPHILDELEKETLIPVHNFETQNTKRKISVVAKNSKEEDYLTISTQSGEIELSIRITESGPILTFSGVKVELTASNKIELLSEEISLVASKRLDTECHGDRTDTTTGDAKIRAKSIELQATLGSVQVKANDDVALVGERIFLNK